MSYEELKIRDYTRSDQKTFSFLLEAPKGFRTKIASLKEQGASDRYVDFIVGMPEAPAENEDMFVFRIACYDASTGITMVFDKEFIYSYLAEEAFMTAVEAFRKASRADGFNLFNAVVSYANGYGMQATVLSD